MDKDTPLAGKKILVVDDEPDLLGTVAEVLEPAQVVTAENFEEALRHIENETFDLVILDIMGVRGFDLLEACRLRSQPAAMLTAKAINVESLDQSVKLGAVSFIPEGDPAACPKSWSRFWTVWRRDRPHWARLFPASGNIFQGKTGRPVGRRRGEPEISPRLLLTDSQKVRQQPSANKRGLGWGWNHLNSLQMAGESRLRRDPPPSRKSFFDFLRGNIIDP